MSEKRIDEQDIEVLSFEDDMSAEKAKDAKKTTKRLLKYMAKQKFKILIIFISVLISSALTVLAPMVMGKAIDQLFNGIKTAVQTGTKFSVNFSTMGGIVSILLGLYLISAVFIYIQQYIMSGVAQNLVLSMRKDLSDKLNKLPLKYYDSHKKGETLSIVTNDLEKVADSLQEGLMQLITAVVTVVGSIVMMISISVPLTIVSAITLLVSLGITVVIARKSQERFSENQKALGELNSNIEEIFTGQIVVKAFSKEKDTIRNFKILNQNLYNASRKAQFSSYAISPIIRFINLIGYVIIAVVGGIFASTGAMTLGSIQAFIQYVNQASEPTTEISYIVNMLQAAIASAERVFTVMDEVEEIKDEESSKVISMPKGKVQFEHVKFGYSDDFILMKDININLNAGDKIAIVGPTGAGKTTLVNLLMRFYEIQGGRITIDGVNIKDLKRGELRTMFGMVLQDTWLFNGSIKENIAYSKSDATMDEIVRAAKSARVDHFIRTLPQGYDTILTEDSSNLSQGQKQLLTIARAILSDPSVLILDEATSSVDTRTEVEIQKAMNNLMKGRTSFVIAHRLSTIRDADLILVMKEGTIIEQGSHKELIEKKGFYEELYNSQFTSEYDEDVV
ncbi:TPA: ABC transporter ATP-binding protein [Clostridioides difficile]|uniref:ABC-type transport system, multidrug-family ATP-binding protein/permease n=1 Tax=Clostridioides difficile (strain 630) TaxID=272563 RepID=Q18AL8_CLOD6|nr:ABC transporter ATP-binding protein [Clostridioides difficile]EQF82129.1 ABC transporter family protein [Clostridioides difficile CD196]AJP10704.1 ABC-type transport system, multidrug-family ATP-binding protein / permease [Clostridioides difficile 630]ARE61927.1 ABC-type transport system, multidrug-family ATP-binding protein / permease [Clostridioides difficile]AXB63807.1 ABC transporter permease/ATP-binding protein [Clostridioides difficile]EGT3676572.1 ABC transporter ATP-binding protein 